MTEQAELVTVGGYVFALASNMDRESVQQCLDMVMRYHPTTDTWQCVETTLENDFSDSVVALHGLIYVIGAHQVQKYNTETSVWTDVAPTLGLRYSATACTLKGKIYVIGIFKKYKNKKLPEGCNKNNNIIQIV